MARELEPRKSCPLDGECFVRVRERGLGRTSVFVKRRRVGLNQSQAVSAIQGHSASHSGRAQGKQGSAKPCLCVCRAFRSPQWLNTQQHSSGRIALTAMTSENVAPKCSRTLEKRMRV